MLHQLHRMGRGTLQNDIQLTTLAYTKKKVVGKRTKANSEISF